MNRERPMTRLDRDLSTDVAIVGAGIAGVSTAYFALKYTRHSVALIEGHILAHGATGHNAGQVTSYFERGFSSIAEEFGLELAAEGQHAVDSAWELLDEMYSDCGLDIPFSRFTGHAGLSSREHVLWHLKNNRAKQDAGLHPSVLRVREDHVRTWPLPPEFAGLYEAVPAGTIKDALETLSDRYVAVVSSQKGCLNSALLCQEMVSALLSRYPDRFALYEETPIGKIVLHEDRAILDAGEHEVSVRRVVLCTNGFETVSIFNKSGLDIDAKYHHIVSGKVGYMSAYLETMNKLPIAISYYTDPRAGFKNSYFYLTRRPFDYETGVEHNLISIGGPDADIAENVPYSHELAYPDAQARRIDRFLRETYDIDPNRAIDFLFTWHGLMGYTLNGLRLIGPEPQNPVLLYNLGCNGVGILPSLHGARTIARHLAGEEVRRSIFDVPNRAH
jgi:glycine/D-amino acid oxidase-like deaminating enzyme